MDDELLKFGMSLNIDMEAFKKEWNDKQKDIQKIINDTTFKVKIGGIQGLTEVQKEVERFARGIRTSSKVDLVNTDSIKGLKDEIRALEIEWSNLSKQQKFSNEATRELTPHALELVNQYRDLRVELERYGLTLKEVEKMGKSFAANRVKFAAEDLTQPDFQLLQMAEHYKILERDSAKAYEAKKREQEIQAKMGESLAEAIILQNQMAQARNADYAALVKQLKAEEELSEKLHYEALRRDAYQNMTQRPFVFDQMAEYYKVAEREAQKAAEAEAELNRLIEEEAAERKRLSDTEAQRGADRFKESQRIQQEKQKELKLIADEYNALKQQLREEARLASMRKNQQDNQRYASRQRQISEGKRIQQILSTEAKTLDAINQRLAIQRQRLSQATIGSAQYRKIERDIEALEARLRSLNGTQQRNVSMTNAQTNAYRSQTGVLNGLKQFMNSYISLLGGFRLLSNIKQITSEFELQRVSLRAITQDAEFADALFARIKTTATESPFATKELVTYTKQLAAYRIENEHLYDTMSMLADVSAGLGVSMDRLILAYGQVKAASVLRGTELRQFTEAGIPLVDELAKKFSQLRGEVVSTGEVFDLISTRQVPFEMVSDIFKEMTAEGGRFYEMQKKQSESLYGVFENLKDNIQNAYDEIGQSNRGLLMGIGKMATAVVKNLSGITAALTPLLAAWGTYAVSMRLIGNQSSRLAVTNALLIKAEQSLSATMNRTNATRTRASLLMRQAAAAHDRYTFALAKAAAANNVFTRSLYRIRAALIANPITAIFTAIAAVVAGGITLWNRYLNSLSSTDKAHKRSAEYIEAVEKPMKNMNAQYDRLMKKIKEYDILIQTQGKSLSELKKIYPELFNQYSTDAERQEAVNTAMKERVALINELKSLAPEQLSNLSAETASVEQLALAWQDVTEEQRKAQLQSLEAKKAELEELIRIKRAGKMDVTSASTEEGIIGAIGVNKVADAAISGYQKQLDVIQEQIDSITKANQDAADAQLLWRKEYNQFMKGNTLKDHELAALNFAETIKETRDAWKEAKDRAKEYQDAIDAAKTQKQTAEVRKNVEEYKRQLATQRQIIKNAESYAKFAGFSLQTGGKVDTTPLDNLKSELSLVEKIYKRYGELRRLMSDEAAKADIEEIYGNLTDVDFLDSNKLKERLQKMLSLAKNMGPKGKQFAIELGLKIQDIDLNDAKDKLEAALNKLSQQIKQQQDASNFFEKILGLTGDVELSTNLTLGVTGVNVKDGNMGSLLSQQLAKALVQEPIAAAIPFDMQIEGTWNEKNIQAAIQSGKITVQQIQETIDNLTAMGKTDLAKTLQSALESYVDYNKQLVEEMYSTINKFGDAESKIESLKAQRDVKIDVANRSSFASDADWGAYVKAVQRQTDEAIASIQFDELKKKFAEELSNLDIVSGSVLDTIKTELLNWLKTDEGSQASEADRKSILELIEKIDDIKHERNPFGYITEAYKDLAKARKEGDDAAEETAWLKLKNATKLTADSITNMASAITNVIDTSLELAEALGISFSDDTLEMIEAFKDGLKLIGPIMSAVGAGMLFTANASLALQTALWPLLVITLALASAFAVIKWISGADVRAANKEIEKQEQRLTELDREYKRLQNTQEELVGSDWVRNQILQIENLQQKVSAFQRQLDAEQSEGKKADEDAINDYKDSILDAQSEIRDSQRELISEMTGTSAVDTIKEFADAAVEAYLTFGNATDAMKKSFRDMIKSMVANSLLARVIQNRLEPIFNAIDAAYKEGTASDLELANISEMMKSITETLPEELESMLDGFEWLKDWRTPETGDLTGIAKGAAQASEESVVTLSGYANSLLYNQVILKNDVAAIRAVLEGRMAAVSPATTSEGGFNVGQLVSLQQQSLSQLQAINLNTGRSADSLTRLEDKLDSIISAPGTTVRKVVNTRLSN